MERAARHTPNTRGVFAPRPATAVSVGDGSRQVSGRPRLLQGVSPVTCGPLKLKRTSAVCRTAVWPGRTPRCLWLRDKCQTSCQRACLQYSTVHTVRSKHSVKHLVRHLVRQSTKYHGVPVACELWVKRFPACESVHSRPSHRSAAQCHSQTVSKKSLFLSLHRISTSQ